MDHLPLVFIGLGALFLISLATDALGRRTPLPRVTLLLVCGVVAGPSALDLVPPQVVADWFPVVADVALAMVGFLLGGHLSARTLRRHGRTILSLSLVVVVLVGGLVLGGLVLVGVPLAACLILAGAATATDPAAVMDVVEEGGAAGPFTETLLGVVAIDDAWGLIAFSVLLSFAEALGASGESHAVLHGLREVGGALLLGGLIGLPAAYLTGRVAAGEPTLAEALGIVFLCCGVALWLEVSFLLATMTMGAVVANLGRHHSRPFHAIEHIDWPFMVLFFVLAGASLELDVLWQSSFVLVAFLVLRTAGRILAAWGWGLAARSDQGLRRWMGVALLPQAGVAIGMGLVAAERLPELRSTVLPIVIGSTVVFEVLGPVLTRLALSRVGELHLAAAPSGDEEQETSDEEQEARD
jgi:Kef-type K+ transport system membrane component KefB